LSFVIPRELREVVDKLPSWPIVVLKILELTKDPGCSLDDVAEVIGRDPVFSLRLLKIVNSAYYNFRSEITSIKHAANMLGIDKLRNLGLTISIISAKKQLPLPAGDFDFSRYMTHSTAVAVGARHMAGQIPELNEEMLFTTGLLHDIGKLIIVSGMKKEWETAVQRASEEKSPLYEAERKELGFDHARISSFVVRHWQLPPIIEQLIAVHHGSPEGDGNTPEGADRAADILRLTNRVVHGMGLAADIEHDFFDIDDPVTKSLLNLTGGLEAFEDYISDELINAEQAVSLM